MKKMIQKPQYFFLLLAVLLLVSGLINKGEVILISFESYYLNLDVWAAGLFSSIFFLLIAVNYASLTLTKKRPKKGLTIGHIVLQVIAIIPFLYYFFTADVKRSYDEIEFMNAIIVLSFVLFLLASFIHIINFMMSLLLKKE